MRLLQLSLNARDQATASSTVAFLEGRLEEKETINWALGLGSGDLVQRWAVLHLLGREKEADLSEPWQSAWRLIEEYWQNSIDDHFSLTGVYQVKERLDSGERSGALVSAIVDLVAPRLKIEVYPRVYLQFRKFPKRPKTFHDLFRVTMTSGKTIDPATLAIKELTEVEFIASLANALDAAVMRGLDIAQRIGEKPAEFFLRRVYYESNSERGIAPSVNLLHAVVLRLFEVDCSSALAFVSPWRRTDSPIHLRLWASISCDARIMSAREAGDFLLNLGQEVFWDLHHHPEVVELRARRFAEFDESTKKEITRRIRGRPPRKLWPRNAEADRVKECRLKWAVRELRRIEVAGATLPQHDKTWLESNIARFPELAEMDRIDEGFLGPTKVERMPTSPDRSMNSLGGIDLLRVLEMKLPADQAWDWFREAGKLERVLQGMESSPDGGAEFPKVWECFSVMHLPPAGREQETKDIDLSAEASRVLDLLTKLPDETISKAIKGISYWLSIWKKYLIDLPRLSNFWLRAWSLAVQETNAMQLPDEDPEQILNTPAAVIIDVFLAALPYLEEKSRPIDKSGNLEKMRKKIISASGRSGLIAKYRMIEALSYSLNADQEWTEKHLIEPLRARDTEALVLWRVVSRQTQCTDILRIIGNDMADRTADHRLDRTTRSSLASSLLVETLHALQEERDLAVGRNRVQQMIRSLDDEVRANCGEVITRFLKEQSEQSDQRPNPPLPEELFQSAAKPFLQKVWPQEHSLVSSAVSSGLAELPVAARGEFAEAVATIERFLVPFDCWSMLEYGFYSGEDSGKPNLSMIDDEAKAQGLLNLLDLTVGTAENAVIPLDLGDALEQVRKVAPHLAKTSKYRRLDTAARRV